MESEERLRNIEGKGPGLAAVSAVIVAGALLAVVGGWDQSTTASRVVLVLVAFYGVLGLVVPLYLVGPVKRHTIIVSDLQDAAATHDPEREIAVRAVRAAMENDVQNVRLTNLLDAARRELGYTLVLVLAWALLVPLTGVLRRDSARPVAASVQPAAQHPAPPGGPSR